MRFGDPECQCLMVRLETDLLQLLLEATDGRLGNTQPVWREEVALTVILAAKGYPGAYSKGSRISGLDSVTTAKVCGAPPSPHCCFGLNERCFCQRSPLQHPSRYLYKRCAECRTEGWRWRMEGVLKMV